MFDFVVAGRLHLLAGRNGIHVGGGGRVGQIDAGATRLLGQSLDQVMRTLFARVLDGEGGFTQGALTSADIRGLLE